MTFAERFAKSSVKGALIRASIAWVLITPTLAAAKIWWSRTAALLVFLVGVTVYVAAAMRIRRRYRRTPGM